MKEGQGHSNFQVRGVAFSHRRDGEILTSEYYNSRADREGLSHAHDLVKGVSRVPIEVKFSNEASQLHQGKGPDWEKWDLEIEIGTSIENFEFPDTLELFAEIPYSCC